MHKTILSYSLAILFFSPFVSIAQITLESSDMTSIGDQILRYVDTIPVFGPGGDGPNQVWDFSNAQNDTVNNTSVVTVAASGYSGTFGSSDYSMTNNSSSYLFFNHDANTMVTTGAAGDLLNLGSIIETPFSDPLLLHEFPRNYGSNFDDTYAFETETDGAGINIPLVGEPYRIRLTHDGHVYDTTDAYGTLITPTGTYDAIRVKTVDFTTSVIEYRLCSTPVICPWLSLPTIIDTSVSYTWHAKEEMLAIAEMSFDSIGNPSRFVYSSVAPVTTVGIHDNESQSEVKLYPQPAQDEVYISQLDFTAGVYASVYSMDGRLIIRKRLQDNRISTSELPSGIYLLHLENQYKENGKRLKLVVRR